MQSSPVHHWLPSIEGQIPNSLNMAAQGKKFISNRLTKAAQP
jgi:hypothetical protein